MRLTKRKTSAMKIKWASRMSDWITEDKMNTRIIVVPVEASVSVLWKLNMSDLISDKEYRHICIKFNYHFGELKRESVRLVLKKYKRGIGCYVLGALNRY